MMSRPQTIFFKTNTQLSPMFEKAQLAPLSEKEINPAGRQQKVQIFELARLSELGSRQ